MTCLTSCCFKPLHKLPHHHVPCDTTAPSTHAHANKQVAAAALRARIASQEYAVRRLETELGKGGGTPMLMNVGAGAVLMASGSSGALLPPGGQQPQPGLQQQQHRREPSAVLLRQLQAHVDEARRLRAEYRALTGKDYVALGGAAGLTVSTAVSAATAAAAPAETASAPLSPSSQQHRHRPRQQPLSPRRLLQRPHSHHEGPSPPRVHTQQHHPGFHVDEGVGSLLACSAPAAPLRELDEQGAAMFPARHAERVHGGAGEEAVMLDPFRWEDGVPGHWHTRAKAEAQARRHGALTWEAVWARLVVLLCFCAMLFAALFVRRFLPTWEGRVGGGEEL